MTHALIFDSGVGGLSVTAEIRTLLPDLRLTYVADDEFRPYGDKTEKQLRARLPSLIKKLVQKIKPDLVVIACNTASTTALSDIRAAVDVPVVGVVPAIKPAAKLTQTRGIAVLGTPGTVRRKYVDGLIDDHAYFCRVTLQGSTALVEQAERKLEGLSVDRDVLWQEVQPLFSGTQDVDVVVLACTHFPLIRDELARTARPSVQWIDSGEAVARRVAVLVDDLDIGGKQGPQKNTAIFIGPTPSPKRIKAFKAYGFNKFQSIPAFAPG
jgi:glutamate racemase